MTFGLFNVFKQAAPCIPGVVYISIVADTDSLAARSSVFTACRIIINPQLAALF